MVSCVVCERATYVRLLECCQLNSESKHLICRDCVNKCDKCPLCREPKRLDVKQLNKIVANFEIDMWCTVNMTLAYYRFKMDQFLTDRITPLEFALFLQEDDPYSHMEDIPLDTNVNLIY